MGVFSFYHWMVLSNIRFIQLNCINLKKMKCQIFVKTVPDGIFPDVGDDTLSRQVKPTTWQ